KPVCVKKNASIQGPFWTSDLHYISDEGGYWNLYTQDGPVFTAKADLGYPPWILGIKRTALFQGKIAYIRTENGVDSIAIFDPVTHENTQLNLPFTAISAIAASDDFIYAIAATTRKSSAIVKINPFTLTTETIRQSQACCLQDNYISLPVPISFTNRSSDLVHLFFYPPTNPHCCGPETEKPPLILRCHGGPTAHAMPAFNLEVQYWTSRGFALADLNYGGSSGYGKAYRERLNGNWGIVDVHDALDAAEHLASKGLVDPKRMVVKGGSAGGYTALAAITFGQTFAAAVSLYGIADLEALTHTTHKFESHYNDTLIGPYPQSQHLYQDRSPIHHLDKIHRPVLLLQGTEDKIVPPAQAQMLYEALTKKGIPCTYHLFEGEGHGFRSAATIQKAIELENTFYMQLFNITDKRR
ncbi:MAG: S9 family peptidase, partial [Chlamydiia bacterium]|nr:S9 family peptidase [Chlamydiia bacterium]